MSNPEPYVYEFRHIGTYHPDIQSVYKRVRESEHLFRRLDAWACNTEALHYWSNLGAEEIVVDDVDNGMVYSADITTLLEDGVPIEFGSHGPQLALPKSLWDSEKYWW